MNLSLNISVILFSKNTFSYKTLKRQKKINKIYKKIVKINWKSKQKLIFRRRNSRRFNPNQVSLPRRFNPNQVSLPMRFNPNKVCLPQHLKKMGHNNPKRGQHHRRIRRCLWNRPSRKKLIPIHFWKCLKET